MVSLYVA